MTKEERKQKKAEEKEKKKLEKEKFRNLRFYKRWRKSPVELQENQVSWEELRENLIHANEECIRKCLQESIKQERERMQVKKAEAGKKLNEEQVTTTKSNEFETTVKETLGKDLEINDLKKRLSKLESQVMTRDSTAEVVQSQPVSSLSDRFFFVLSTLTSLVISILSFTKSFICNVHVGFRSTANSGSFSSSVFATILFASKFQMHSGSKSRVEKVIENAGCLSKRQKKKSEHRKRRRKRNGI